MHTINTLYLTKIEKNKHASFDWLSITCDHIDILNQDGYYIKPEHIDEFYHLLDLLKSKHPIETKVKTESIKKDINPDENDDTFNGTFAADDEPDNLTDDEIRAVNGFERGFKVNDHARIFYGGIENGKGRQVMQILLSGKGCDEFEQLGGSYRDLLIYCLSHGASITRLDISIDDYNMHEINPVEIDKTHIRQGYYSSIFRKTRMYIESFHNKLSRSGWTMSLGTFGSNCLIVYDKNAEREFNNKPDVDTDYWYRYEMRFVDQRAKAIAKAYIEQSTNDDFDMLKFAQSCLYHVLDIKQYNPKEKKIRRWNTLPAWLEFLDHQPKLDVEIEQDEKTDIISRIKWYENTLYRPSVKKCYHFFTNMRDVFAPLFKDADDLFYHFYILDAQCYLFDIDDDFYQDYLDICTKMTISPLSKRKLYQSFQKNKDLHEMHLMITNQKINDYIMPINDQSNKNYYYFHRLLNDEMLTENNLKLLKLHLIKTQYDYIHPDIIEYQLLDKSLQIALEYDLKNEIKKRHRIDKKDIIS
jgi:hypothetical protein